MLSREGKVRGCEEEAPPPGSWGPGCGLGSGWPYGGQLRGPRLGCTSEPQLPSLGAPPCPSGAVGIDPQCVRPCQSAVFRAPLPSGLCQIDSLISHSGYNLIELTFQLCP